MKRGCIYSAAGVPHNLGEGSGNFRQGVCDYWQGICGYYENFRSNYGGYNSGSYCGTAASNYNEADKAMLKKFYRTLSKAFHPDSNPDKDTSEEMKMLNRLKSDWGM